MCRQQQKADLKDARPTVGLFDPFQIVFGKLANEDLDTFYKARRESAVIHFKCCKLRTTAITRDGSWGVKLTNRLAQ